MNVKLTENMDFIKLRDKETNVLIGTQATIEKTDKNGRYNLYIGKFNKQVLKQKEYDIIMTANGVIDVTPMVEKPKIAVKTEELTRIEELMAMDKQALFDLAQSLYKEPIKKSFGTQKLAELVIDAE